MVLAQSNRFAATKVAGIPWPDYMWFGAEPANPPPPAANGTSDMRAKW